MSATADLAPGAIFNVPYPMIRAEFEDFDGATKKTWRPGVRYDGDEYLEASADGLGKMVLTVVSVHKPGRFPTRVFYTRQWITPEGKPFGKGSLKIATTDKFRRIAARYQHYFEIADSSP